MDWTTGEMGGIGLNGLPGRYGHWYLVPGSGGVWGRSCSERVFWRKLMVSIVINNRMKLFAS